MVETAPGKWKEAAQEKVSGKAKDPREPGLYETPAGWDVVSPEGTVKSYDRGAYVEKDGKLTKRFKDDAEEAEDVVKGPEIPMIGQIVKGYKYKGGDPSKPENWEKM
jgi:hypothetical protein